MGETIHDEILDEIDQAIEEGENSDEEPIVENNDQNVEEEKSNNLDKVYHVKLDPVENIAECMALAVEGSQIHELIFHFAKLENTFSEELRDKKPEESEKIFIDKCSAIFKKRSLLEPYIEKVMMTILEDGAFNYSKKLPRLLLMASYYKKKKESQDEIKYYKLTDVDEEGNYIISKDFEKVVKIQSLKNIDFALEFMVDLWTKRIMEETCFERLKKKIQKFLKTRDCLESLKTQVNGYLKYQEQSMKEKETLRQHAASKHIR